MYDDGLDDWKALLFFSTVEMISLLTLLSLIELGLGHRIYPSHGPVSIAIGVTLSVGLAALNYKLFCGKKNQNRYKAEFEEYSKWARYIALVAMAVIVVAVGAATVVIGKAASQLSH